MIFNDNEINHLFFCKKIAGILNNYYPEQTTQIKYVNGRRIKEDKLFVFDSLKTIILKIESFLESKVGHDLRDERVQSLKDLFDNFSSSANIENNHIEVQNVKFGLRVFIWNFYRLINDIFSATYYFDIEEREVSSDEIDSIVVSLYNLNETFGMGFVKEDNISDKKLYERVVVLEVELKKLTKEADINSTLIRKTVDGFVLKQEDYFNSQLNSLLDSLRSSLSSINDKYENEIKGKVETLDALVSKTDQEFKNTFNDYNQLKGLVNIKGEMLITDHYKKRAFWERITYWAMTVATFIIIILSICLALNGLNEYKGKTDVPVTTLIEKYKDQPIEKIDKIYSAAQTNALIYLVLRLIFSVLLFSSIIYTSRVAYRAYVHMRHSENMMLKLATLRPFINQLKEDERNQIHKDLVPDYFGKDAGMVDSTSEKFKDLPANVSAVAMKAIEQISGNSNSSGTEKNTNNQSTGTQ